MSFIKPIDGEKRWAHPFLEVFQLVKKKIWLLSADLVCYKGNELKKALGSFILSLYPEWFLIAPQVKICQFVIVNLYRKFSVWFNNRQTCGARQLNSPVILQLMSTAAFVLWLYFALCPLSMIMLLSLTAQFVCSPHACTKTTNMLFAFRKMWKTEPLTVAPEINFSTEKQLRVGCCNHCRSSAREGCE